MEQFCHLLSHSILCCPLNGYVQGIKTPTNCWYTSYDFSQHLILIISKYQGTKFSFFQQLTFQSKGKPYHIWAGLRFSSKHTMWFSWSYTSFFWSIQDHWMGAEAVIRTFCINALAINTTVGVLTLIHILREKQLLKKISIQIYFIHLPKFIHC